MTPYAKRTDLQKIRSQLRKLEGHHDEEQWSAMVVRAATAAELAANFAIRQTFTTRTDFEPKLVDSFLRSANGLQGKMERLLLPMLAADPARRQIVATLHKGTKVINDKRNGIVHQGEFCGESKAKELRASCHKFVEALVTLWDPSFNIEDVSRKKPGTP